MNTMTSKGYLGSVAYSEKDNVFFGKIEGINGLVNFEGDSLRHPERYPLIIKPNALDFV